MKNDRTISCLFLQLVPRTTSNAATSLIQAVVPDFLKLQAETRRERIRQRKDDCDNRYDGQITSRPRQAQSFAEPEDAKGDDDEATTSTPSMTTALKDAASARRSSVSRAYQFVFCWTACTRSPSVAD